MGNGNTLGRELKEARVTKGFTLRQIEDITKISNAYLSQLENDKIKKPSANVLYKLSSVYRIDFDLLLEAAGVINERAIQTGPKTLAGSALSYEELTREEEEELVKYLKFLRSQK